MWYTSENHKEDNSLVSFCSEFFLEIIWQLSVCKKTTVCLLFKNGIQFRKLKICARGKLHIFLVSALLQHVRTRLPWRPLEVVRECPRNLRGMAPIQRTGYLSALLAPSEECWRGQRGPETWRSRALLLTWQRCYHKRKQPRSFAKTLSQLSRLLQQLPEVLAHWCASCAESPLSPKSLSLRRVSIQKPSSQISQLSSRQNDVILRDTNL